MATTDLEARARDLLAQQDQARFQQAIQELQAADERERQEQRRQAVIAGLVARLEALKTARIEKAKQKLATALEEFADAVSDYNGELAAVRADAEAAGIQQAPGVDLYRAGSHPGITIGGVEVRPQPIQAPVVELMRDLYRRRWPRHVLNLNSPSD